MLLYWRIKEKLLYNYKFAVACRLRGFFLRMHVGYFLFNAIGVMQI